MEGVTKEQTLNLGAIVAVCQCHEMLMSEQEDRDAVFVSVFDIMLRRDGDLFVSMSNGMLFKVEPDGTFQRFNID